jgi:hypothetical protein
MSQSQEKEGTSAIAPGLPPSGDFEKDEVNVDESAAIRREDWRTMEVFVAWERLRIPYNIVLIAIVVLRRIRGDEFDVVSLTVGALMANVCFCAGAVMEGYLVMIGLRRNPVRWSVFFVGMLLAVCLAIYSNERDILIHEPFP